MSKLDEALKSLTEVITEVLQSNESNRFAKAAQIATLTQKIAVHGNMKLQDTKRLMLNTFGNPGYDTPELVDADGNGYMPIAQYPNNNIIVGAQDQATIQRQAIMAAQSALSDTAATNKTTVRKNQAAELQSLLAAQAQLPLDGRVALQPRVDDLIKAIATENGQEKNNADVVPPQLLRGHSVGADGQEHQGDHLRPDAGGEAGDAGADPGSGEATGSRTVLEPPRVPPFRSALAEGADAGAAGADLEGAEDPERPAQAGAGSGERGALRQRQDAGANGAPPAGDRGEGGWGIDGNGEYYRS